MLTWDKDRGVAPGKRALMEFKCQSPTWGGKKRGPLANLIDGTKIET